MSKLKKIVCSILVCASFMTIVCSTYSVQASTKDLEEIIETEYGKENTNNPLWWPGNPNPKPGSEAWLQQYAYKAPKDATTARRCAIQALGGSFNGASIASWIASKTFTVISFARSFGAGWAYAYLECILKG